VEKLLVHKDIAKIFLPRMAELFVENNVEIRGCPETMKIIDSAKPASEDDWYEEYLDLIISIKIVEDVNEAIAHINKYGTKHSDAIITDNNSYAGKFLEEVDSACVYHNASTRFTDGGEFGLGAEIGISTDKIHARGPMALEELTIYKYVIYGNGQTRT
jgi:glutamate-5-semialdehyde dehydrogenase